MSVDDKSNYALCKNLECECLKIGAEQQELVRVDSYMQGVDVLRQDAVARNKFAVSDSYYPGVRMDMSDVYIAELIKNFRVIIRDFFKLDARRVAMAVSKYSIVTFKPEDLDIKQRIPHFDAPSRKSLAVIHYLCDEPDSGTSLYRHRETGFEYVDNDRYQTYMRSVQQRYKDPELYPSGYICGDTDVYEEIASFQAVSNRLLMYRGSSLHSGIIKPDYNFDSSPETGRLTVTSFIEFS